jgi:murein DD-endopeptidase MepM/ murein hydrolase activator NlpD
VAPAPGQPQVIGSISAPPGSSGPPVLRAPVERVAVAPPPSETAVPEAAPAVAPAPETQIAAPVSPPPQLAPLATIPPRSGRTFEWPVRGKLLARYGTQGKGLHNDGINIAARSGTRVRAAESGVVAYAGNELRGFGNLLIIKHADGWVTAYAHNEKLLVGRGDQVSRGQDIAVVGATGNVSEPQLHFEIRRGQRALDPLKYLAPVTAAGLPAADGIASPASFPGGRRDPG